MNAKAAAGRIEKACKRIAHLPNMTLKARIIRRELTSDEECAARFSLACAPLQATTGLGTMKSEDRNSETS